MTVPNLSTEDGLRAALETLGRPESVNPDKVRHIASAIERVRSTPIAERASRAFLRDLWEDDGIAGTGQGHISVDEALDDDTFRRWFAERTAAPLPAGYPERVRFMEALYDDIREQLAPHLGGKTPHLKTLRALAVLYPEVMTAIPSKSTLAALAAAMGGDKRLGTVERHLWVRRQLDQVLGPADTNAATLAQRLALRGTCTNDS